MGLFSGEYICKIDAKGRLSLPVKVKSNLPVPYQNEVVLRKVSESCLVVYTQIGFQKIASKFSSLNEFNPEDRLIQRHFFRSIHEVTLDSVGRILIPKKMLEHAGLGKEALLIGMGDRLEIWDERAFDASLAEVDIDAKTEKRFQDNEPRKMLG